MQEKDKKRMRFGGKLTREKNFSTHVNHANMSLKFFYRAPPKHFSLRAFSKHFSWHLMQAKGPKWDVPTGRRDGRVFLASDADNLPGKHCFSIFLLID